MKYRKGYGGLQARSPPVFMTEFLKTAFISMMVALLCFAVLFSGWNIVQIMTEDNASETVYQEAQSLFLTEAAVESTLPTINWAELKRTAPDVVGWLFCPDTPLDYPIVQGNDNSTYLNTLYNGAYNRHGAIFVDWRNGAPFVDANTLVYGHNMADGSMFHGLLNWGNASYAEQHSTLYVLTPKANYAVTVFSAFVTEPEGEAYAMRFDAEEKILWLSRCVRQSFISASAVVDVKSPIVTFSTCSGNDRRFVVQGVVATLSLGGLQ